MGSSTEDYVRNLSRPALRRQFQPIALRIIAKTRWLGADCSDPPGDCGAPSWHQVGSPYPLKVLADNGIVKITGTTMSFVEILDSDQIASLLSALDERAVRTRGLRVEDACRETVRRGLSDPSARGPDPGNPGFSGRTVRSGLDVCATAPPWRRPPTVSETRTYGPDSHSGPVHSLLERYWRTVLAAPISALSRVSPNIDTSLWDPPLDCWS